MTYIYIYRLEDDFITTIRKFDISLKRYYVVCAVQSGKIDKVLEFFQVFSSEISTDESWSKWLSIPYLKSPETDPHFKVFFHKSWYETLHRSLENFLSTIFQSIPLPRILNFNVERTIRRTMQEQINTLLQENESLKKKTDKLREELRKSQKMNTQSSPSSNQTSMDDDESQDYIVRIHSPIPKVSSKQDNQEDALFIQSFSSNHYLMKQNMKQFTSEYQMAPKPPSSPPPLVSSSSSSTNSNVTTTTSSSPPPLVNTQSSVDPRKQIKVSSIEKFSENSSLNCCKFSPDGNLLACGTNHGVVRIWSVSQSNKTSATIYGSSEIMALEWEQTSNLLLCGFNDGRIRVWNVNEDSIVSDISLESPYSHIKDISCSPLNDIFSCSVAHKDHSSNLNKSGKLIFFNSKTLQMTSKIELTSTINSLSFNHNGSMMILSGNDGHIYLFDVASMASIASWKAHQGPVLNVKYSHDETAVYSIGYDDQYIRKWSIHNPGKIISTYNFNGTSEKSIKTDISFDSNENYFIVPSKYSYGSIYHEDISIPILAVGNHKSSVTCCDWHPHDNKVLTGSSDGTLCLSTIEYTKEK